MNHTNLTTYIVPALAGVLLLGVSGVNYYFPSTTIRFPEGCS